MKKKRAKLNLAGIIFVCILLTVLAVVQFPVGAGKNYVGFLRAIELGIDYKGGTTLVLEAKNNTAEEVDFASGTKAHAERIQYVLESQPSPFEAKVYAVAGSSIAVEIYDECDANEVLDIIKTTPAGNRFKGTISSEDGAQEYLNIDDIESVDVVDNTTSVYYPYLLQLNFTKEGQERFSTMWSAAYAGNKTLYFYIGNEAFIYSSGIPLSAYGSEETYNQSYLYIPLSTSKEGAEINAGRIMSSKYDFSFEQVSASVITEELASRNLLLSCIVAGVIIVACFAVLIIRFKMLGLINALALFIGLLLQITMLQAVPGMVLTATAFVSSVIVFIVGFALTYYLLKRISNEYAVGKKAHISFKYGYQKNYTTLLEISIAYLVASILFYIFGSTPVRYFAYASIIGIVIYALCALVLTRWFNNLCFDLYLEKANKYGFKREANINELEEI